MNTEIYYFSGTGNSLFIAQERQKRIPDSKLIPIVCLLKRNKIVCAGKSIGIVFPEHALTIPIAVKRFLQKIDLANSEYIFAAATRHGTVFHGFKKIDQMLSKQNKHLNSGFVIDMCNNDVRTGAYITPSESDIAVLERDALRKLDIIVEIISEKGSYHEDIKNHKIKSAPGPVSSFMIERSVLALMEISEHIGGVNYFYHDDKCTGCGICEKVCLSEKIQMIDKKPVWQKVYFVICVSPV